jgi:hypothetical protein
MDAQLKAKWVKALRGRKFKQGRQMLHNGTGNEYCCLGVLCVVADKPLDAESYAWLNSVTKDYGPFVKMNDEDGKSFKEIADYIEENL